MRASFANLASSLERSDSDVAAAIRLRSLVIFSLRTRRRRISGLRLGADMNIAPWFQGAMNGLKAQELLETESILRQAKGFCRTAKKLGWQFASPFY